MACEVAINAVPRLGVELIYDNILKSCDIFPDTLHRIFQWNVSSCPLCSSNTEASALCRGALSVTNAAVRSAPWHRGSHMEPLAALEHLREPGTGGWVVWTIGWDCGFTRLLVDVKPAIPSAEFVLFDHMSGSCANWRM